MTIGKNFIICSIGLFLLASSSFAQGEQQPQQAQLQALESEATKSMKHFEVIPDVITEGPKDFLKVTFDNGVIADKGVELTPTQVKNQPKIEWKHDKDTLYTLLLIDPDAPSHADPKMREWNHWLVGNIPGDDISKGDVLTQYVGSAPPEKSGFHRYVFLLFKQPKRIDFTEPRINKTSAKGRGHFSTKNFAKKYNLGTPIAGNIYQAQWDRHVPEVYRQLGY